MSLDLFLLEIAPCPQKQYLLFRDRHKNCNLYTVNSVAKCLKLACLNADWKSFVFNVERIGLGFPLIPIILRWRGLKIVGSSKNCLLSELGSDDQGCQMQARDF